MSIYIGPPVFTQVVADTPNELLAVVDFLSLELDWPVRFNAKMRPLLVKMGAIELSRREFVQKMFEIEEFGHGLGPKRQQICR